MENFSLNRFYKDVLSHLNFSITGYPDIKNKIDGFLNEIITKSTFYEKPHLKFISYTYSKINDIETFSTEKIDDKSFFFNAFKEYSLEVFVLNEYYLFKKHLDELIPTKKTGADENQSLNGSSIVSKLFCNPVSFGVSITTDNFVSIHYNQHEDILFVKIPTDGIFNLEEKTNKEIRRTIFSSFEKDLNCNKENIIKSIHFSISKKDNFYEVDKEILEKKELSNINFFNIQKIKDNVELIKNKLILLNHTSDNYFFRTDDEDFKMEVLIEALAKYMMAHAFLSFLLNVEIENLQSVVYDKGEKDKRSIGLLIAGYSAQQRINPDERAMLKIVAERISYCIAAQNLLNNQQKLKFKEIFYNKEDLRKTFKRILENLDNKNDIYFNIKSEKLHGTENLENCDIVNLKKVIKKHIEILGECFINKTNESFGKFVFNKNCFIKIRSEEENCNTFNIDLPKYNFSVIENHKQKKIVNSLSNNSINYINLPLIEAVLNCFQIKDYSFTYCKSKNEISLMINEKFDFTNFYKRFQIQKTGSIRKVILEKLSSPLIAQGNFTISCCDENEFFNLEEILQNEGELKIKDSYNCECSSFKLNFIISNKDE